MPILPRRGCVVTGDRKAVRGPCDLEKRRPSLVRAQKHADKPRGLWRERVGRGRDAPA